MKIRFVFALLFVLGLAACSGESASLSKSEGGDNVFSIPLAALDDGQAHFYQADAGGKNVRFFAMKSGDGVYRAAFDACDVCYEAKKGYTQDGEFMVCNNCGQRFHSSRINEVKGGCNPAPLNRVVEGDHLVIALGDIAQGGFYF